MLGFLLIYVVAFTVPAEARFVCVIAAVVLNFCLLNLFYIRYLRRLKHP